jgi:hypothetical protein
MDNEEVDRIVPTNAVNLLNIYFTIIKTNMPSVTPAKPTGGVRYLRFG